MYEILQFILNIKNSSSQFIIHEDLVKIVSLQVNIKLHIIIQSMENCYVKIRKASLIL